MKGKSRYRILAEELRELLRESIASANDDGKEICGLIVSNESYLELIRVRNRCRSGGRFSFYPSEVRAVQAAANTLNHQVVGTFHSHPYDFASPGESDIENAMDDSLMLIIDALDREVGLWHIKNGGKKQLRIEQISLNGREVRPVREYRSSSTTR